MNLIKQQKEKAREIIISAVLKVKQVLSVKRAVRFFGISVNTFYSWKNKIQHKCSDSILGKCVRRWPNQLTSKETQTMKTMLTDNSYQGWSVVSIAMYALKRNLLSACVSTCYKYMKALHIERKKAASRRKHHDTGIRTDAPYKLLHMDVTVLKTTDNIRAYIYILMDNFSRYILGYRISLTLKAETTLELVKDTNYKYFVQKNNSENETGLMTDGGTENTAVSVQEFLQSPDNTIKHIIAQVDTHFSNSMVEAVNKKLKYGFLYLRDFPDFKALERYLPEAITEYNEVRPHYAHGYLTPKKVLDGQRVKPDKFKNQLKQARIQRNITHRDPDCQICVTESGGNEAE